MANFDRQFPTGVALNDPYPSDKLEAHDIAQSQSVNGDEGSDHEGYVTLGGLRQSGPRRRIITTNILDGEPAGTTTIVVNHNLGSANSSTHYIVTSGVEGKTIILDFQGNLAGVEYTICLLRGETADLLTLMQWGGTGITHHFPGEQVGDSLYGRDSQPEIVADGRTIWTGLAVSATSIWWQARTVTP